MKSGNRFQIDSPATARKAIEPSLRDSGKASCQAKEHDRGLEININADSLGVLRACNDTVFRLSMLHDKVMNR
jgi:tRNA threonylcarbamoyladenosine modification (KEOPS) complex  Pcc1 subunit